MKNRRHRWPSLLVAGLLVASSACAAGIGSTAPVVRPHDPDGVVQLKVTNYSEGPMEIYAAGSGTSYRIGTVKPGFANRYAVRPGMMINGPVELLARTGHGRPWIRTGQVRLAPGDVVDFEVASAPLSSFVTVRP